MEFFFVLSKKADDGEHNLNTLFHELSECRRLTSENALRLRLEYFNSDYTPGNFPTDTF